MNMLYALGRKKKKMPMQHCDVQESCYPVITCRIGSVSVTKRNRAEAALSDKVFSGCEMFVDKDCVIISTVFAINSWRALNLTWEFDGCGMFARRILPTVALCPLSTAKKNL